MVGNWRKGDPCYVVAEYFAELSLVVMWKEELMNDETGYLAEKTSKHSVVGKPSFFFRFMVSFQWKEIN